MELQEHQLLFSPEKEIDVQAKEFIRIAYKIGISVKLINRFVRECNYACTITIVQEVLGSKKTPPNNYNCSRASLIWKRYLTHILETFNHPTLERFKEIALDEAKEYYDIDENTFIQYWQEFSEFQTQIVRGETPSNHFNPLNTEWMMRAFLYFGYNLVSLTNNLKANNNHVNPSSLYELYKAKIRAGGYSSEQLILCPKYAFNADIKKFWKRSRGIGKEFHTIIEWTVIFTGRCYKEQHIRQLANIN